MHTSRARTAVSMLGWMSPLRTAGLLTAGLLTTGLLTTGCMVHSSDGHSVEERDGKLIVDGERLDYDRWAEVSLDTTGLDQLACGTSSGPVELAGGEAGPAKLQVRVHSAQKDDGEVYLDGGKLSVRSQHGGTVYINGVRGSVPPGLSLDIDTASGDVSLQNVARGARLSVDTASGDVSVKSSQPNSIDIDSASGQARLEESSAAKLSVDTASGDVTVVGGAWGTISVDGASSDVLLKQCTVEAVDVDTASGDLIFSGGHCKRAELDAASGGIELRDGAVVDVQRES